MSSNTPNYLQEIPDSMETGATTEYIDVFKFSIKNPDLNKLDSILTKLQLSKDVIVDTKKQTEEKNNKVDEIIKNMELDSKVRALEETYDMV